MVDEPQEEEEEQEVEGKEEVEEKEGLEEGRRYLLSLVEPELTERSRGNSWWKQKFDWKHFDLAERRKHLENILENNPLLWGGE